MLVVDQHAFHERVLFERLLTDEKLLNSRQPLLMPEEVSLTPTQMATLAERKEDLLKRGFAFSETEVGVEVREIPAILMGKDIDGLFQELSDPECAEESTESNGTMARLILATIACHGAVRAGEELGENELKILLAEAPTVNFYHNCPHGRRVFKWWSKGQIERWFDR
jgi:DNA mismatch repair protein MutL